MRTAQQLLKAAHGGPAVAVTAVAGLLAVGVGHAAGTVPLVVLAVLAGQLVIGWSNDLLDVDRDRRVGRSDKPLATGELRPGTVVGALAVAGVGSVVLSALLGPAAAACHLVLVVGSGLAYNAILKRTWWSWAPYAVAFGSLPAVATMAFPVAQPPPTWMVLAGALLGVGAHLVNVLPDLDADAATGVRGLPHRLGARVSQLTATVLLVAATVVVVVGAGRPVPAGAWAALLVTCGLAAVAVRGTGRTPFRAAIAIALLDVLLLTLFAG